MKRSFLDGSPGNQLLTHIAIEANGKRGFTDICSFAFRQRARSNILSPIVKSSKLLTKTHIS